VFRSCERDDESSGSIKGGEYFDQLSDLECQEGLCTMDVRDRHVDVGPCHHVMARPRVAEGRRTPDVKDSCECIE
jgi:hypothetical protein